MKLILFLPFLSTILCSPLIVDHNNPNEFYQLFMYTQSNVSGIYWNINQSIYTPTSVIYNVTKGDFIHILEDNNSTGEANYNNTLIFPIDLFFNDGKPYKIYHESDIKFLRLVWQTDGITNTYPPS